MLSSKIRDNMSKDPLYGEKEEVSEADAGKKQERSWGIWGFLC